MGFLKILKRTSSNESTAATRSSGQPASSMKNVTPPTTPSLNMISEGTQIKGNMTSDSDIRIAGRLKGDVTTKGKLILAPSGTVEGNIHATEADLSGSFKGELKASSRLILRNSARVDGNVQSKAVIMEEGAQLNGTLKMGVMESVQVKHDATEESSTGKSVNF